MRGVDEGEKVEMEEEDSVQMKGRGNLTGRMKECGGDIEKGRRQKG